MTGNSGRTTALLQQDNTLLNSIQAYTLVGLSICYFKESICTHVPKQAFLDPQLKLLIQLHPPMSRKQQQQYTAPGAGGEHGKPDQR